VPLQALFRSAASTPKSRQRSLRLESLESRMLLATLTVNNANPVACATPGDNLYCEFQEAVDAAKPGDTIRAHTGRYLPFTIKTDNLTIRPALGSSKPVIDGSLNLGNENGVEVLADGVTIIGLTSVNASGDNSYGGDGFRIEGDNNRFFRNIATNNAFSGFQIYYGDLNTLEHNEASGNGVGFGGWRSNNNVLRHNSATSNNQGGGFGFLFAGGVTGNLLTHNSADNHSRSGFEFNSVRSRGDMPTSDNTLTKNIARNNGEAGFRLWQADENTLTKNIAENNGDNGFKILDGSHNRLVGNTATSSDHGFYLEAVPADGDVTEENLLTGNQASNNNVGFLLSNAAANTLKRNRSSQNSGSGFELTAGANNNILILNKANSNGGDGFSLSNNNNNILTRNKAINNYNGYQFDNSDQNRVSRNAASRNRNDGYSLSESDGNLFTFNTAKFQRNSGTHGFVVVASSDNEFSFNRAIRNGGYGFFIDTGSFGTSIFSHNMCINNGWGGDNQNGAVC